MSKKKDHLPPGLRKAVDQFSYDEALGRLEVLRCSNCLEPLAGQEPVYEVRSPSPDPDGEWEVTDHYCIRCVSLDQTRRKRPHGAPKEEGS